MFILTIVLLLALAGSLPTWPYSKKWGYLPVGALTVVMVIVLMLFATGRLRAH
jgi:hypothetical protein